MRIKLVCTFLLLLLWLFSVNAASTFSLLSYLKQSYLGKKITLQTSPRSSGMRLKIVNVVLADNQFKLVLETKQKMPIRFTTSSTRRRFEPQETHKKTLSLQLKQLRAQESINNSIKSTLTSGESAAGSSSLNNLEANLDSYISKNYFTTLDKITYSDKKSGKSKKEHFIVNQGQLYLVDGTPVDILVDRGHREK